MSTHAPTTSRLPRLRREETQLFIVDVQERLLPAMFEAERVLRACALLARAARQLQIPVIATEQNPQKLGPTHALVADQVADFEAIPKMLFSACTPQTLAALKARDKSMVLLCGLETHVCVMQTALDLIENNFQVFVPADAVSSRYESDKRAGLERMKSAGAVLCTTEMAVFELLREAGTSDFKTLLPYLK